jgi:hypothetical protein
MEEPVICLDWDLVVTGMSYNVGITYW